jgi:hypothetical protein
LTGFTPNREITVRWEDGSVLATVTADGGGGATASFRTPLVAYGTYDVTARDATNRRAETQLSVIPRILLNETSGPSDTRLRVYFYGFTAGERVEVRWSDKAERSYEVLTIITIASNGRGTSLIDIPEDARPGTYVIRGKVIGVSRSTSTTFTLTGVSAAESESEPAPPRAFPTLTVVPTPTQPVETPIPEPSATPVPTIAPSPTEAATAEPTPTFTPEITPVEADTGETSAGM